MKKDIQIARDADVSPAFICMIQQGQRRPSPDVASRLEAATGKHRLYWLYPGEYDEAGNHITTLLPPEPPHADS